LDEFWISKPFSDTFVGFGYLAFFMTIFMYEYYFYGYIGYSYEYFGMSKTDMDIHRDMYNFFQNIKYLASLKRHRQGRRHVTRVERRRHVTCVRDLKQA
jgi:hypothetical protein